MPLRQSIPLPLCESLLLQLPPIPLPLPESIAVAVAIAVQLPLFVPAVILSEAKDPEGLNSPKPLDPFSHQRPLTAFPYPTPGSHPGVRTISKNLSSPQTT
jgi:hypothetical protein